LLWYDAVETLSQKSEVYVTDRVVGTDSSYALPVRVVTNWALAALFKDNMYRAVPDDIERSVFANRPSTLLSVPYDKLDASKYEGRLRKRPGGETSDIAVAMDCSRRLCVVNGSAYGGSVKKSYSLR
jgi:phosphoenolpyruvate carboxykinase (ATP)